ncbi:MAG: twin-arginine translocase subunit TatC [Gammaproteobacteria bacterium]|nr:twin-arginine translocase subunit TatC [Gammaproteobacteria bacterium]
MATSDHGLETELPFLAHLVELRDRLLKVVITILVVFLALFTFANDIYAIFAGPLIRSLPEGGGMIATGVATPFLTPFKLTLVLSFYIAIPVILFQLWAFIAPGLYQHEKKLVFPLMISSIILFYAGVAFAYFLVMPMVYQFMGAFSPEGVAWTPDIAQYLSFALTMFFAFGVAFEVPIATIVLVWTGMTTPESLAEKRPYIIVGAFVIGMLITPPDVISQVMLALPMWFLFEIGVIFSRFFVRKDEEELEEQEDRQMLADDGQQADQPEEPYTAPEDGGGGLVFADDDMNEWKPMSEEEMDAELNSMDDDDDWEDAQEKYAPDSDSDTTDKDSTEKPKD